jgi:hypothetical protein
MAIKITCPHCKRGMLVPENLAGKKGKCKACQGILTVPQLAAPNGPAAEAAKPPAPRPAAAAPAPPSAPADVEAAAAALFADEPKPVEPVEVKLIDFSCPYCDEAIQLPADLAGKRAPCPECKRVIKVPELVKKDPKDWRKMEARGPSGARLPDQPELEGAWGSTTARGVGKETLQQAGLLPKVERPRTLWQKTRLPVLGVGLVVVVGIGSLMGYRWWAHRAADRALAEALAFAATPEAPAPVQAAVAIGAGEYYLNSRTSHKNPPAVEANNQLGKALTTLRSAPKGDERDALLGDLALALVELGGDLEEINKELRLSWDEVQKRLVATLAEISNVEARLQALRRVVRRLLERGESRRVLPLTNQVYPPSDPEKTADKAAALAVAGFEFHRADDKSSALQAAEAALAPYTKDAKDPKDAKEPKDAKAKSPPLRAEVVALAQVLGMEKKAPAAGDNEDDKANEHIGKVMGLARQGEWGQARTRAGMKDFDAVIQFRAHLALAAAAVDTKVPDAQDVESAMKVVESDLKSKTDLSWFLLRLTQLALAKGLPHERVQALADKIGNSVVRSRAQLAIFRAQLAQAKQPVEDSAADKIEAKSVARAQAAQALARHNTRLGASYAPVVQGWPQPQQAFGSLGIALGLVDREK